MLPTRWKDVLARVLSRADYPWKRGLFSAIGLLLVSLIITLFFWNQINQGPRRVHITSSSHEPASSLESPTDIFKLDLNADLVFQQHPINDLIIKSEKEYQQLIEKETSGVAHAAQTYRNRRGRHPPPRFDKWVAFAETHGCLMIEDHFDRIYHDLNPFWALSPDTIRNRAAAMPNYIEVRDGKAYRTEADRPFMESYFDLIQQIATYLPDLHLAINTWDESRVLLPWQTVAEYVETAQIAQSKQNVSRAPDVADFASVPANSSASEPVDFITSGSYWDMAKQTCPSETEARSLDVDKDFSTPPIFPTDYPYGTHSGFVRNYTVAQDFCYHPHLRNMHGTFVEPVSISTTTSLVPIFGGSKLLRNNDILLPAAMYWADNADFAASKQHIDWHKKRNEAFWRGTGSGGRNKVDNWTRFHRHRLVSLLNGTQVDMALRAAKMPDNTTEVLPHNIPLPNNRLYPLVSDKLGLLVDWIRTFSNAAFYWLECFPPTRDYSCSYTGSWYRKGETVPLQQMFEAKYLPDVDGNSFSGRFRAFLLSNSLPIKSTIYTEWHDSRLIPWKHFVPMDNTFRDLWSIFEFLFQNDEAAGTIAVEGRKWADRVLRKEDMLAYVYRLLLEYARLVDPKRDDLGFGQDLK